MLLMLRVPVVQATERTDFSAAFPDPQRFTDDIAAFAAADSVSPPPTGATLCIGSSSLRMWQPTMAADLAPLTVIPRGFGGSTMYDVLHYSSRIVLPYRPKTILLYEGDNDIDFGISPARFMNLFDDFTALVHERLPRTRLYVLSIKPCPFRWHLWPRMQQTNRLLRAACDDDPLSTYIDVATPMLGADGRPLPHIFLEDDLHMNAAGYEIWARTVKPILAEKGGPGD